MWTGRPQTNNNQQILTDINIFHSLRELLQFVKDNDDIAQEIAVR